jgi:nitrogen fixation protein NifQ
MSINITSKNVLEKKVCELLINHASSEYAKNELAPHVAKVSLMMNHLYQDLGFRNRFEMGMFMKKNFSALAQKKPKTILWKKYIYDSVGEVAPACENCKDSVNCFACNTI